MKKMKVLFLAYLWPRRTADKRAVMVLTPIITALEAYYCYLDRPSIPGFILINFLGLLFYIHYILRDKQSTRTVTDAQ